MEARERRAVLGIVCAHVDGWVQVAEALRDWLDVLVVHPRDRIGRHGALQIIGIDRVDQRAGGGHQLRNLLLDVGAIVGRRLIELRLELGVDRGTRLPAGRGRGPRSRSSPSRHQGSTAGSRPGGEIDRE